MLEFLRNNYPKMIGLMIEHFIMAAVAVLIACVVAVVIILFIMRFSKLKGVIAAAVEVIYTIPSLAMFVLLLPLLGLGNANATVALSAYALVFLMRNFITGLEEIDPNIIEASKAMGMNIFEQASKVVLPLSLPSVIAGIRSAMVACIGIGTIAYTVGAGGIGSMLFEGLRQLHFQKMIWGIIMCSSLALCVSVLLSSIEKKCTRIAHRV